MKYEVTIKEVEIYVVNVSADSSKEAKSKAEDLLEKDKYKYHNDSDGSIEAYEVGE